MFTVTTSSILVFTTIIILNILDSVTTRMAFKQYPDPMLKEEGNPIMRRLILKNRTLAEAVKHTLIPLVATLGIITDNMAALRLIGIVLGLVVLNNSWIVISRAITKRKVISPLRKLQSIIHIPDKYLYIFTIAILIGIASLINMAIS